MLIAFLFPIFFYWSYLLEIIAYFLLHQKFKILKIDLKNPVQLVLLCSSTITFIVSVQTFLPKTPIFFILVSALWITIFTDLSHMLISRWVSLYLIPIGFLASWCEMTHITFQESILSSGIAAGFFMTINKIFYRIKGHDGLGQGDIELLACIAAWIGALGTWVTITIGSTLGSILGLVYILIRKKKIKAVPFGPFIALGAIIFSN
ncbi:prepilin peptidase [Candidatus Dependentiae bacterium]|nr:prepilin peptidase [Candidatus Dependentiae bacterium]